MANDGKLPSYVGNVKSPYKDPYQTTSIFLESKSVFLWLI